MRLLTTNELPALDTHSGASQTGQRCVFVWSPITTSCFNSHLPWEPQPQHIGFLSQFVPENNLAFSTLTQRHSGVIKSIWLIKMSDKLLAWLSLSSKVQMICIWSSWCHCHPIIFCFIKIQTGLTFLVSAYLGCPRKEAVKELSVLFRRLSGESF